MKKKIVSMVLAAATAFGCVGVFAGCGGNGGGGATANTRLPFVITTAVTVASGWKIP